MENLKPAISDTDKLSEISPQEFQQLLSNWFEEKGILSQLRSHAKYEMINALKSTSLGKKLCKTPLQAFSLSEQALHLVVAEYLLRNQCHYSFSLFSSEANLAKVFPESKLLFDSSGGHGNLQSVIFDKENLTNILELIGISKNSEEYGNLIQTYFGSDEKSSILTCLVNVVSSGNQEYSYNDEIEIDLEDDFLQKVSHILLSSHIPPKTYVKVMLEIKKCHELKTKSFEDQCLKLINKFRGELNIRSQKLHSCNRKRKRLEKHLLRSTEEQKVLKEKVNLLENKEFESRNISLEGYKITCGLDHCSETCKIMKNTCENYEKENERLKEKINLQANETKKLKLNHDNLKQELINCQCKINLLKSKLQNHSTSSNFMTHVAKESRPPKSLSSESSEVSSNNMTEEVLIETRKKLQQLEEESEQIDLKYKSFVIR